MKERTVAALYERRINFEIIVRRSQTAATGTT
jgi:hypothetical protein